MARTYERVYTHQAFCDELNRRTDMARRIDSMRVERARSIARAAGVYEFSCLHNAMVDLHYGRPWVGVNYSLARKARRLLHTRRTAYSIVGEWYTRMMEPTDDTASRAS